MIDEGLMKRWIAESGVGEQKRAALQAALDAGRVRDPITAGLIVVGKLALTAAITAAASYAVGRNHLAAGLKARREKSRCR